MITFASFLKLSYFQFYSCIAIFILSGTSIHIYASDIKNDDVNLQNEGGAPHDDILIVHDGVVTSSGVRTPDVKAVGSIPEWDTNGYIMFCPCMGRFGNQMEHVTGALAFAKTINRTLILPPLREDLSPLSTTNPNKHDALTGGQFNFRKTIEKLQLKNDQCFAGHEQSPHPQTFTPFSDWFQVEPLQEFQRVIKGEDFMKNFGDKHWPPDKRKGYCRQLTYNQDRCDLKRGQPMCGFWDYFNVSFMGVVPFELTDDVDLSITSEVKLLRRQWSAQLPGYEHPVLALYHVPASFPVLSGNRFIQKYFKWNVKLLAEAHTIKKRLFGGEKYLGIHLRVGEDWGRVCELAIGRSSTYFASPQCKSQMNGLIFQEMCYPDLDHILELTKEAIVTFGFYHLYIASDDKPYKEEFQQILEPHNVTVHHYNPISPQMDVIILGEADFFIGNCISTFTSFIKRERDANKRPSTFWGFPI